MTVPPPNAPKRRLRAGPRPLPLHLATAAMTWLSSAAALPFLRNGSAEATEAAAAATLARLPWHPSVREHLNALVPLLAAADPDRLAAAVSREVRRRLDEFETGLRRYRHHPYERDLSLPRATWRDGTTQLRDYGTINGSSMENQPILVIPSLVNRSYVLDLSSERSLLRFLARRGFRPFLVDWDRPGPRERRFDLADYILDRLGPALDKVIERTERKPAVLGYCMGGNLALGLAQARSSDIASLALLATPWDFHAERGDLARASAHAMTPWLPLIDSLGELPVDMLQSLFFALDPFLVARKFRAFAKVDADTAKAREFVALEDWLNDGVPLVAKVARDCILGWYGANTTARGEWRLRGTAVEPQTLRLPTLLVIPEQDRIVPPASALALAAAMPAATVMKPPLGHIGMVVGSQARDAVWEPLARWLDLPSSPSL